MADAAPHALLTRVPLFTGFTPHQLSDFLATCDEATYSAGTTIFAAGETGRMLFVVLEGTVQILLDQPVLSETLIAEVQPGEAFGEGSFFHAHPHSATARAATDVRAITLDRATYDQQVAAGMGAALRLAANAADLLAARLQQTDAWLGDLLQQQQNARVTASWQRFRAHIGHGLGTIRAFGIGAVE